MKSRKTRKSPPKTHKHTTSGTAVPGVALQKRILALVGVLGVLLTALLGRLFYIQIIDGERMQQMAASQNTRTQRIVPKRGSILDRNGDVLAISASSVTVDVTLSMLEGEDALLLADVLAEELELDVASVRQKLTDTTKGTVTIKRQVPQETKEHLRQRLTEVAANIKRQSNRNSKITSAVAYIEDARRYYPHNEMLEQVLGFCDVSSQGQTGLEKTFDKYLAGTAGSVRRETDTRGYELPYNRNQYVEPIPGRNLVLTIDSVIQSLAEKAMQEALEVNLAKKTSCVIMNVKTGAILGMVNKPSFDLNNPPRDNLTLLNEQARNSLISDVYDPGSTFKIVTTASALDSGAIDESFGHTCTGSIMVEGDKIRCWRSGNPHGHQSLTETLENSCNPAFVEMGLRMGKESVYNYLDLFGFGRQTGIEVSGEAEGIVRPIKYVKDLDLARIAFGQSISVTPIQLIAACSAVVNGGKLMQPYLVSEIQDTEGNTIQSFVPQVVSEPVSASVSAQMREMLESVVENGSGRNAYVPGYRVGGKTGTAQKFEDGRLVKDAHVSSFIGFAPMDDPQIAILVIVDESELASDYGSTIAAPFAGKILQEVLPYMNIQPTYKEGESQEPAQTVVLPSAIGMDVENAKRTLEEAQVRVMVSGKGGNVVSQLPAPGTEIQPQSIVTLYLALPDDGDIVEESQSGVEVPDLTNKSVIEANRILRQMGLQMKIEGTGLAYTQQPLAGRTVPPGSTITVKFRPPEGANTPEPESGTGQGEPMVDIEDVQSTETFNQEDSLQSATEQPVQQEADRQEDMDNN